MFFHANCLCHINYASVVWGGAAETHLRRLNSLLKRGIRIILPNSSLSMLEKQSKLNILSLQSLLDFNKYLIMYKVKNNLAPLYLSDFLTPAISRYGSTNYILPRTRIDLFKTSFAFSGASLWNSLPDNIKTCSTLSTFKSSVRKHLMIKDF